MSYAQPPHDPDLEPATAGELNTLKRWVTVAGIWAAAASAIALIALFDGGGDVGGNGSADQVTRLAGQIDDLEAKVDAAAEDASAAQETATGLAEQIDEAAADAAAAEESASEASSAIGDLQSQLEALAQRVDQLEQSPGPPGDFDDGE